MQKINLAILLAVFGIAPAIAADYTAPTDGTMNGTMAGANGNASGNPYEIEINGAATGSADYTKSVSITGTTADAKLTGGSLTFTGAGITSSISGITISGGGGSAIGNAPRGGAGQTLTLTNVILDSNIKGSSATGGAITNTGVMTIDGGAVTNSKNTSYSGGGIFNSGTLAIKNGTVFSGNAGTSGGAIWNSGNITISNAEFNSNTATSSTGGAIGGSGTINITSSQFNGNTAVSSGGAIYMQSGANILNITDTDFINNKVTANNSTGGGAIALNQGTLNITRGTFDGNTSASSGGAVVTTGGTIAGATFKNNQGRGGGAVYTSGAVTFDAVTMTNNTDTGFSGGAINANGNTIIKNNSVFTGNSGTSGGAVTQNGGTLSIDGATFTNNTARTGSAGAVSGINMTINNAAFSGNTAQTVGGAAVSGGTTLQVSNTTFSGNASNGGNGGGGLYTSATNITLDKVGFDGNTAATYGGAFMALGGSGLMTIRGGAEFTNNTAVAGGAIFTNQVGINLDTTLGDITFSGNTATDMSAGMGGMDIFSNADTNVISITGDGNKLTMDGGFGGIGTINKTGANELMFLARADNSVFDGDYNQTAGLTTVYADNFFAGANNISGADTVLHFVNSASVNNLNFTDGATLDMRTPGNQFSVLTVASLTSDENNNNIMMHTNGTESDLLKITDNVSGAFTLHIDTVGTNPTLNKIEVVDMTGATSDATFALAGSVLDIGAFEYNLVHEDDMNWYLETQGDLTGTAETVQGIPAMQLSIVKSGLNELRKRLGALRNNNGNEEPVGAWVRGYGKQLEIHEKVHSHMTIGGIEAGFDWKANALNGKVYFGLMGGMLESNNIKVFQGTDSPATGATDTPSAGAYLTWMHRSGSRSKWFVDLTARHFWVHTRLDDIAGNGGATTNYDVRRNFWAFSAETGHLFYMKSPEFLNIGTKQHSHLSIEPKLELRYKSGASEDFTTSAGDAGHVDTTRSFATRVYMQTNFLPNGTQSAWKPWLEVGVYNEWSGATEMSFAGADLTASQTKGMGVELAAGTSARISDRTYGYGGFTVELGHVFTSYLLNIGIRTKF